MATILLADDQPVSRTVTRSMLTRGGYDVIESADGQSALEKVRACQPDLALVNLLMPEMDGFEFVHALRREGNLLARIPVIFISSAYMPEEVRALAKLCGVSAVLTRRESSQELLKVVSQALSEPCTDLMIPDRRAFSLELLKLMHTKLAENIRTVIPVLHSALLEIDPDTKVEGGKASSD